MRCCRLQPFRARHEFRQVGLKLYTDTENNLPISMILIPFHDTIAVWTLCSLYHEVGHLFDNDLNLRDELTTAMTAALKKVGRTRFRSSHQAHSMEFLDRGDVG